MNRERQRQVAGQHIPALGADITEAQVSDVEGQSLGRGVNNKVLQFRKSEARQQDSRPGSEPWVWDPAVREAGATLV